MVKYEVVCYHGDDLGGLLCISLKYAGAAGLIGPAFSEATCNPKFGQKDTIIGIPAMMTPVTAATDGSASLGPQNVAADGSRAGPWFVNPGKYQIPAGGILWLLWTPSLNLLSDIDKQTLIDGSVSMMNPYSADADQPHTQISFVKYLPEPGEVGINPYETTLFLYAVAPLVGTGEYGGNSEWTYASLNLLNDSSAVLKQSL